MQTENRPTLSFDGKGINGPDEYRSRVATFTSQENAERWGPMFEAAPDLLAACRAFLGAAHKGDTLNAAMVCAHAAITKAEGGAA